jgi:hypothetical protein
MNETVKIIIQSKNEIALLAICLAIYIIGHFLIGAW